MTSEEPAGAASGAASRLRLFQAVLTLLGRLSAVRPVVHVVEDVQWADRSTLDLLAFLATNLTDERVLVVLTQRTDTTRGRVAGAVAGRARPSCGRVERLPVGRLDRSDVADLVTELRDGRSADRLDALVARSAGNPLFVEQLALVDDDAPLPDTLQELLRTRVAELPEETRQTLGAAAVLGRPTTRADPGPNPRGRRGGSGPRPCGRAWPPMSSSSGPTAAWTSTILPSARSSTAS